MCLSSKKKSPETTIELLIPDLCGNWKALEKVLDSNPNVLNHNIETVSSLYKKVRPQGKYERTLELHKDWTVSRDILEAGEVARLGLAILKVDIECAEVRIPGFQVFGAGVVGVTDGQVRSLFSAEFNDLLQGASDL